MKCFSSLSLIQSKS